MQSGSQHGAQRGEYGKVYGTWYALCRGAERACWRQAGTPDGPPGRLIAAHFTQLRESLSGLSAGALVWHARHSLDVLAVQMVLILVAPNRPP